MNNPVWIPKGNLWREVEDELPVKKSIDNAF